MIKFKDHFSGFSHLIAAFFSIIGLYLLIATAQERATQLHVISYWIYGISMILLFFASAIYHLLDVSPKTKKMLKKFDHIMIYFLIAGSYTPFCLIPLKGGWGWSILTVIWLIAFFGIVFKIFFIHAPRWISTAIYLIMGWICIIAIYPLVQTMPPCGIFWLAAGGIFYSVGAVIYAIKKPNPFPGVFGFHDIWHLFVIAGSFCHYLVMYLCIMKIN